MQRQWTAFLILILTLSTSCFYGETDSPETLLPESSARTAAPPFELTDVNGETVSLESLRGKVVLLDFWATWCAPCIMIMPILEELQAEFPDDLVLLGVNFQEAKEDVSAFLNDRELNVRALLDSQAEVADLYQVDSLPTQILIDQEGRIVARQIGLLPPVATYFRPMIQQLLDQAGQ